MDRAEPGQPARRHPPLLPEGHDRALPLPKTQAPGQAWRCIATPRLAAGRAFERAVEGRTAVRLASAVLHHGERPRAPAAVLPAPPLVHAAAPGQAPGQTPLRSHAPVRADAAPLSASRPLEEFAAAPAPAARGSSRLLPAAPPPPTRLGTPELRAVADRVYETLVQRLHQERRARGL